ncbi:MAG: DUF1320 family protein [Planctomycetes bacterium]|nr:DUF1320 family protein [Planctomycetota bacterium]
MPYATPTDLLERYDARLIGDLVRDDGVQEPANSLPANTVLLAVLADASAAVDAAVFVGNRYTVTQMAALSETAAAFVRRLTCDLALVYLKRRRGRFDQERDAALLNEVNSTLQSLRNGTDLLLLNQQSSAAASTLELVRPELIPVVTRQTIRNRTRNYYPDPPNPRD